MDCDISTYTTFGTFYQRLLSDIRNACQHVFLQFFKFEPDAIGQQLGAALISKARQGLDVRLLYDDFVCRRWRWYYRHLQSQGVSVAAFAPLHKPLPLPHDYFRNHRKNVSIDGAVAYTGGMNIAERYLHGLDWGCWRDTMIRLQGPESQLLQTCFLNDWNQCTSQADQGLSVHFPTSESKISVITSNPIGRDRSHVQHTIRLLDEARRYAWFESPYFIPTKEVMHAMCNAAKRGVDVRVLQPPRGDKGEACQWASRHHYREAMDAGVRIGIYRAGFLHSKIIVSDDRVGVVSSCNIDHRSYRLCQEVAVAVDDPCYASQLRDIFAADEAQSSYIDPDKWKQRPLANRIEEKLFNITSSQL